MKQMYDQHAWDWLNENELSYKIWNNKYRVNNESFDEWLDRVSGKNEEVKELIKSKKFLFGGRILANRNVTNKKITLSNCYVVTPPEDNIESIFECAQKLARTYSYGGGCGIDLSKLRPKGAMTNNASKESTGPVSFMDIYSQVTGTISQAGRRGALMISLDINHPDIEEFIDCKNDLSKVNYANISVRVNDEFMKAVENNVDYYLKWPCDLDLSKFTKEYYDAPYNTLTYIEDHTNHNSICYVKKVKAKQLFQKLAKNNWNYAEPGILYWDNIENYNLLSEYPDFHYGGVNPCAEEPLPPGGSCLLGSLNLSSFIITVGNEPIFDYFGFEEAVKITVRALNTVLLEGLSLHPLQEQRDSVAKWRQIGLGTMGLADCLIEMGYVYGSEESLKFIRGVYRKLLLCALTESCNIAKEKGAFDGCDAEKIIQSNIIQSLVLHDELKKDILKYGLYNSQLLTCAPTGSLSTMLGISGGIEPIYAMKYTRTTKSLENGDKDFEVYTPIAKEYLETHDKLSNVFVESKDINPIDRVKVQSMVQKYTDASISSTINLDESATVEDVYNIYLNAWKNNLKGVTVFRRGCARTAILNDTSKSIPEKKDKCVLNSIKPVSRDEFGEALIGYTYKHRTACGTLYITINKDSNGNIVEIFTNSSKNGTCKANLNGETRMASLALRAGVTVAEVIDQLKGIHCQSCAFARAKGNPIDGTSCPDIIAKCIQKAYSNKPETVIESKEVCPECGQPIRHEGGCIICPSCGYSKC